MGLKRFAWYKVISRNLRKYKGETTLKQNPFYFRFPQYFPIPTKFTKCVKPFQYYRKYSGRATCMNLSLIFMFCKRFCTLKLLKLSVNIVLGRDLIARQILYSVEKNYVEGGVCLTSSWRHFNQIRVRRNKIAIWVGLVAGMAILG